MPAKEAWKLKFRQYDRWKSTTARKKLRRGEEQKREDAGVGNGGKGTKHCAKPKTRPKRGQNEAKTRLKGVPPPTKALLDLKITRFDYNYVLCGGHQSTWDFNKTLRLDGFHCVSKLTVLSSCSLKAKK